MIVAPSFEAGDRRGIATMKLFHSIGIALLEGEERARAQLEETLATFEDLDDLWGIGTALHAMSRLRVVFDRFEGAGDLFERAVAVGRTGRRRPRHRPGLGQLGDGAASSRRRGGGSGGDRPRARTPAAVGITYAADDTLEILARIEHADGEHERAIALLAAADIIRNRLNTLLWPPEVERHERLLAELRAAVGDEAFEAAYVRGAALDVDDAQEIVLRLAGGAEQSPATA